MEERYVTPEHAGMGRKPMNNTRPVHTDDTANSRYSGGTMNASTMNYMPVSPHARATNSAMNNMNAGTLPETAPKTNMGAMPYNNNMQNTGMMPEMQAKQNTGLMPETHAKPNTGTMPDTHTNSNTGLMPYAPVKPNTLSEDEKTGCSYKNGELPSCAPLSVGYVPFQQKNPPKYGSEEALTRGTLFPGLDLPFKNIANKTNPYAGTPLGELMALGFVIKELNLYLDTHKNDKEALDMFKSLNKLMQEGRAKYVQMYGPLTIMDITSGDEYTWLNDPWPWEFTERGQ